MDQDRKIGTEMPDIPLGLGMSMAQTPEAMEYFGKLDHAKKLEVINYVEAGCTGDDAKHRVRHAVDCLKNHDCSFIG